MTSVLKRRGLVESFEGRWLDIIGVQETNIKGCGMIDYMMGSESEVWMRMEVGVVWCVVDEKCKRRRK